MSKRGTKRKTGEADVIVQANPPEAQRARFTFVAVETANPLPQSAIQGKVKTHRACKRLPAYAAIRGLSGETVAVLEWYDKKLGVARSGMTMDSLLKANSPGGGAGMSHPEAAAMAWSDLDWAKSHIMDGLTTFVRVMELDETLTEIGNGSRAREDRARSEFKLAASWLLLGVGSRVFPC